MDFVGNRRKRTQKTIVTNSLKDIYTHDLQLYTTPPRNEIQLSEFEELALERLQLFRILEQASQKGNKIYSNDWKECVFTDLNKHNLKKFYRLAKGTSVENPTEADLQARRTDHISHFILRLAYCRTEPLRKWFLARELEWFKFRFQQLSSKNIETFLATNNLTYSPISSDERSSLYQELYDSTAGTYIIDTVDFYKIQFTEVPSLIRNRRVFVKGGFAYIPSYELVTCILGIFRTIISESLVYASRRLPLMDDDRINFLISNLHNIYVGNDYTHRTDSGSVSIANLDAYVAQHFPLCMRHTYTMLKQEHHLRHTARLHLGLFLKGIGLKFDDAMTFWREEFTKKIDTNAFEKHYAYNVKHMYGKAGNMTDYSPFSCMKIIQDNVGPGDHHGCPFKHWDSSVLRSKLTEFGMGTDYMQDIVDTATKGHFQIACSKYFEYTHGQQSKTVVTHPNQYFTESLELSEEGKDAKSSGNASKKQKVAAPQAKDSSVVVDDVNWDETFDN